MHVHLSDTILLMVVVLCGLSLVWKIVACAVIMTIHITRARMEKSTVSFSFISITMSYILMLSLTVVALLWEVYHYDPERYYRCFPLWVRICITIPALLLGDFGLKSELAHRYARISSGQERRG